MHVTIEHQSLIMKLQVRPFRLHKYVQFPTQHCVLCCDAHSLLQHLSSSFVALLTDCPRETNRTQFYLDKNVHLWAAWSLFCSCTQSYRWCFCRSVRSRHSEAHTRQYLWETGRILTEHLEDLYITLDQCSSCMWSMCRICWPPALTFACFSIRLQRETNGAAASHTCGCVFTGAVAPPIVHCAGFWNDSTQSECARIT